MSKNHNHIDIYCERIDGSFWSEPVNAVTNLSFIIAAAIVFLFAKRNDALDYRSGILIMLVFTIGVGSSLFHTYAVKWAMLADVIPIAFFQLAFLWFYSRDVIKMKSASSIVLLAIFFVAMYGAGYFLKYWLNGTLGYSPALVFVAGFGIWHAINVQRDRWLLLSAAGVFIISMAFRSTDMNLCEAWPLGTHFMWHVLNGLVLFLSVRSYISGRIERSA